MDETKGVNLQHQQRPFEFGMATPTTFSSASTAMSFSNVRGSKDSCTKNLRTEMTTPLPTTFRFVPAVVTDGKALEHGLGSKPC